MAQLRDAGFNARDVTAQGAQARRLFKLGAGLLQSQIEYLLAPVPAIGHQLRQAAETLTSEAGISLEDINQAFKDMKDGKNLRGVITYEQ